MKAQNPRTAPRPNEEAAPLIGRRGKWVLAGLSAVLLAAGTVVVSSGPAALSAANVDEAVHGESCSGTATLKITPGLKRTEQEITFSYVEGGHSGRCVSTLPITGTKAHEVEVKGKGDCESAIVWVKDRVRWTTDDQSERTSLMEFVSTFQIAGDVIIERSVGRVTEGELKGHIIENNTIGRIDPAKCDSPEGLTEITLTGLYNTSLG
ncbi:hypothetical protein [Saccharopolyspora shandongensis]|uniref:hypothetical protein n=1 Tax=Saccharopolyspora shandongensis TaxID=418495 RepID=UPI0033C61659